MMIRIRYYVVILGLLLLGYSGVIVAQDTDFKTRLGLELRKSISKKIDASVELEHRTYSNANKFEKLFLEPSLSYTLIKDLKLGIIWRLMLLDKAYLSSYSEQRFSSFVRYGLDFGDFNLKFKTILQYGFDDISNPSFGVKQKLVNRNSVNIEYDWFGSRLTPNIKYELFYYMNDPQGGILNQWRLKSGLNYNFKGKSALEAFYMFENEFNVMNPVDAHIFGVAYLYKL